jgi:MoaA/NifB/PqqE/SkfB family radical SAM enzyme
MSDRIATIDFHVTSECSQDCPYCWGPQEFENPVDTDTALRIVAHVKEVGARRIVFTGGDPLKRDDIAALIRRAREVGLEVALSTTGDQLTRAFLDEVADLVDLISLPLDGSREEINARTKEPGHLSAVLQAFALLREHPSVDVKICTPVTRRNLAEIPNIARLAEAYAEITEARVFYNVFQAFPRAMFEVDWEELLVSPAEFRALEEEIRGSRPPGESGAVRINFLGHDTLDRLYVMVFPDGSLMIPVGAEFRSFGPFLEMNDLDAVLERSQFDWRKHLHHSKGWEKRPAQVRAGGSEPH